MPVGRRRLRRRTSSRVIVTVGTVRLARYVRVYDRAIGQATVTAPVSPVDWREKNHGSRKRADLYRRQLRNVGA